jgi:hypothetical protein
MVTNVAQKPDSHVVHCLVGREEGVEAKMIGLPAVPWAAQAEEGRLRPRK